MNFCELYYQYVETVECIIFVRALLWEFREAREICLHTKIERQSWHSRK